MIAFSAAEAKTLPLPRLQSSPCSKPLFSVLQDTLERCTECGICVRSCAFLARYGTPRAIATFFDYSALQQRQMAYRCSLCGLCTAICPAGVDPCALFLQIRRYYVESGSFDVRPYRALIRYEALGGSRLFSWFGLPDRCDTVFFPGCTLSGTRPAITRQIYQQLRRFVPSLGIILACCGKPSHDLGCVGHFQSVFGELLHRLSIRGITTVLTACPSCTKIFREYGKGLSVQTVYEVFQTYGGVQTHGSVERGTTECKGEISVHDPCQLRDYPEAQLAVRSLLVDLGYTVVETHHRGKTTLCCGEGGAVGCIESRFSHGWMEIQRHESKGLRLVTCCAGCTAFLGRVVPTFHILDLLFRTDGASDSQISVSSGMMTYINRLLLKLRLVKMNFTTPARHNIQ